MWGESLMPATAAFLLSTGPRHPAAGGVASNPAATPVFHWGWQWPGLAELLLPRDGGGDSSLLAGALLSIMVESEWVLSCFESGPQIGCIIPDLICRSLRNQGCSF